MHPSNPVQSKRIPHVIGGGEMTASGPSSSGRSGVPRHITTGTTHNQPHPQLAKKESVCLPCLLGWWSLQLRAQLCAHAPTHNSTTAKWNRSSNRLTVPPQPVAPPARAAVVRPCRPHSLPLPCVRSPAHGSRWPAGTAALCSVL